MNLLNKLLVVGLVSFTANLSLAATMTCELENFVADKGGLMPAPTPTIISNLVVQTTDSIQEDQCQKFQIDSEPAAICAILAPNTKDVYQAAIIMEGGDDDDSSIFNLAIAYALFGLHKNEKDLVFLKSESILHPTFKIKMTAANLSYPNYKGGDSAQIDEAVVSGVAKSVIPVGSVVSVGLGNCRLDQ